MYLSFKQTYQFCIIDSNASAPISIAHVTSHLTISLRLQFSDARVIRITCKPNSKATLSKAGCLGPDSGVANLKASWASLNRWDEL